MTGLGWEKGLGMGEPILEIISEWESAPGMGDICALTGGERKVVSSAPASQLTRNKNNSQSRVF